MRIRFLLLILFILILILVGLSSKYFTYTSETPISNSMPSHIATPIKTLDISSSTDKNDKPIVQITLSKSTTSPDIKSLPKIKKPQVLAKITPFGISFGDTLPSLSNEELNKRLDDLVSLGLGWMRFDISWQDIQNINSTTYNWTDIDRIVAAANVRRIRLLPDISYTPAWARPANCQTSDKCGPLDPMLFAQFAKLVAERYSKKGISHFEIWNEPNIIAFWRPLPNAEAYSVLLKATYSAIKTVQPSAVVISGGLAPIITDANNIAPIDFLKEMYLDGSGTYFDAVGFHPYSFPILPSYTKSWNAWSQMSKTNPSLRSVMIANGDESKPIWLTEYGAPTGGPKAEANENNYRTIQNADHVTETLQSNILSDAIYNAKNISWAGPLFWYSYKDLGESSSTNENFFGLIRLDGSLKPAFSTLQTLMSSY